VIRKSRLSVRDLYLRGGIYEYSNGINGKAVVALIVGIAVALLGLAIPGMRLLYDYAWFVGFGVSGAVYLVMMQRAEAPAHEPEWEAEG
jgi:NCS1 family nucleobase:cation symporter-1